MPVSLPTCQFPYQHASFSFLFYVLFVLFSKESSFRVKGGEGKCLIRIGAKHLNCLLHIAEWGMTLALERTHAVLSQWPLTTIRNYECTDDNEFVFEAGRKSPMGEGKYHFHTTNNEDNTIFDQLDRYTSLRAKRVQSSSGRRRLDSGDDDMEIAQAYGKLRWSVMLNDSTLNLGGRLTGDWTWPLAHKFLQLVSRQGCVLSWSHYYTRATCLATSLRFKLIACYAY